MKVEVVEKTIDLSISISKEDAGVLLAGIWNTKLKPARQVSKGPVIVGQVVLQELIDNIRCVLIDELDDYELDEEDEEID